MFMTLLNILLFSFNLSLQREITAPIASVSTIIGEIIYALFITSPPKLRTVPSSLFLSLIKLNILLSIFLSIYSKLLLLIIEFLSLIKTTSSLIFLNALIYFWDISFIVKALSYFF